MAYTTDTEAAIYSKHVLNLVMEVIPNKEIKAACAKWRHL